MKKLSEIEIDKFSKKILEDYDNKCPGTIFKSEIKLSNEDGLLIQSKVTKLRMGRGEKVIGYKIGCVSKDTQTKMGFNQPASGTLWESEIFHSGVELEKKKKRDRYYHLEEKGFKGELTKQEIMQKNELKQYINKMNQINENFLHEYKIKSMTNNEKEKKYKEESANRELWEVEKKRKKLPKFINTNFLAMYQREKGKNNIISL